MVLAAIAWVFLASKAPPAATPVADVLAVVLGGQAGAAFQRVLKPRTFRFPRDHGPHPRFKHEWWYVTGNLESQRDQRRFGYQITFFRIGLTPKPVQRESAWATSQVYMGHLALTDVKAGKFHHHQRVSRAALQLAGAVADPFRVWLDDWHLAAIGKGVGKMQMQLRARQKSMRLRLNLAALKSVVLQGEQGLSQKSAQPGNASYYYSISRMETQGSVEIDGQSHPVRGLSWLDREWSTSALGPEQAGWDWFALQLSNGWDLMFYQMRRKDGKPDPMSRGALVSPTGQSTALFFGAVNLSVRGFWQSPHTGVRYPSGWRLISRERELDLIVDPHVKDQELYQASVRYWEGAVSVHGFHGKKPVTGNGYVELAGYGP